jgi:hypothetical protein
MARRTPTRDPAVASAAVVVGTAACSTAAAVGEVGTQGTGKKRGLSDRWRGKGSRGKYRKISSAQRQAMEVEFKSVATPDSSARDVIAAKIGTVANPITNAHVLTWFMNRRTKQRKIDNGEQPKSKKARRGPAKTAKI